jgi:hypothetical protein
MYCLPGRAIGRRIRNNKCLEYICTVVVHGIQVSFVPSSSKDIQAIDSSLERFWNRPRRHGVQGEEPELRCTAVGTRIQQLDPTSNFYQAPPRVVSALSLPSGREAGLELSPRLAYQN